MSVGPVSYNYSGVLSVTNANVASLGTSLAQLLPGKNIMLMGAPVSGKGSCGNALQQLGGAIHMSMGDLIKREMEINPAFRSKASAIVCSGRLLGNDMLIPLLEKELCRVRNNKGVIFDWHPNGMEQLDGVFMAFERFDAIVFVDAPEALLRERVINRLECTKKGCGGVFNSKFDPPDFPGKCNYCKSPLETRATDQDTKVFDTRMENYKKGTLEVAEYFKKYASSLFLNVPCTVSKHSKVKDKYLLTDRCGLKYVMNEEFLLNREGVRLVLFNGLFQILNRSRRAV